MRAKVELEWMAAQTGAMQMIAFYSLQSNWYANSLNRLEKQKKKQKRKKQEVVELFKAVLVKRGKRGKKMFVPIVHAK